MAQKLNLKAMAEAVGISEAEMKIPNSELIKLLAKKLKEAESTVEIEDAKETIENVKKLDELKKHLSKPFDIYVTEVGSKKSSAIVSVVGYVPSISSFVAYRNENFYKITDDKIIKTTDEYEKIKQKEKAERAKKAAETKAKNEAKKSKQGK